MFVSVQFKLEFENKQDKEKVLALMRLQSSAIRFIYNRVSPFRLWGDVQEYWVNNWTKPCQRIQP
ncbi:hypothetical protein [Thermocrinis sp.]